MTWINEKPAAFSLNEAAAQIFPGSTCRASKLSFEVKISKRGKTLEDREDAGLDYLFRVAIPALAVAMPFAVWYAGQHPFLIGQAGAILVAALFGGMGVLANENLEESFSSGVRDQLGVAKAASSKEAMTAALLKLIWGMRERRPPFATVIKPYVLWSKYSNNVNRFALEPAHEALKLLLTMKDHEGKLDWTRRWEFDGYLAQIEKKLDVMDNVWDRSIKWPRALHGVAWYCGSFLFLLHMAIPLLNAWAGR